MTHRIAASRTFLIVLVLSWATLGSAQQDQKAFNYGIVSPNTKTDLKLEQAIAVMKSEDEAKLLNKAVNLSCVVRTRITAFRALGSWSDGAEPSVLVRVRGDEATLRYVLSRMGRDAQQKYVIYFHPTVRGAVDLYTLRPRSRTRNLVGLTNELERAGIPFRTLVPSRETTAVYIIDLDRDLREKIMNAARKLRARVSEETGTAQLFGDDEREKAKLKFEQEIKDYETKNPNLPPTCDMQRKPRIKRILKEI
jgi:hypothetical protein